MKFGRNAKTGHGKYEWVGLTQEEIKDIILESVTLNIGIWLSIPDKVEDNFVPKETIFEACSINTFTLLKNKLDRKIYKRQEEGFK